MSLLADSSPLGMPVVTRTKLFQLSLFGRQLYSIIAVLAFEVRDPAELEIHPTLYSNPEVRIRQKIEDKSETAM